MLTVISYALLALALLLAIPVLVLFLEVVAAVALPRRDRALSQMEAVGRRTVVLVPAHNESTGIQPTLADIRGQLNPDGRLLVVADNCDDDTATVAAAAGAEVIERRDPAKRGKGYALDFGIQHLSASPPDILIIIDADCRLAPGTIGRLASTCAATRRPVQALDLMTAPQGALINYKIAEFAWRIKNWLRPLGLDALGCPCQLVGTGMAFPWEVMGSARLASGELVEDLKLGLDLAVAGKMPLFCPGACVTSHFPFTAEGADSQRRRWEQGHINIIRRVIPSVLRKAIARRDWRLLALALDLSVPPLSLLGLLVIALFVATALATILGFAQTALLVSAANLVVFLLTVGVAWLAHGQDVLPVRELWSIGPYVLSKVGFYRRIFTNRSDNRWVRTDRSKSKL